MSEKEVGFVTMGKASGGGAVETIGVGMLGYAFMGKAHSNAYRQVARFFPDVALEPVMHRDSRTFKIRSSPTARFGTETFDVSPLLRILHASLPSQPRDRPISFQTNINVDPCPAEDQDSMIYCQAQHTYQSTCISSFLRKHTTTSSRSRLANVAVTPKLKRPHKFHMDVRLARSSWWICCMPNG